MSQPSTGQNTRALSIYAKKVIIMVLNKREFKLLQKLKEESIVMSLL
jgi:hypothetical protein